MKYSVDKKLDLRRFKKIVNDEIINVCDNYIEVVKKFDFKYIMDIHGKCLHVLSPFTFEIKYLGKGYFIKIQSPKLIPNIYKDDRIITGIKDVRFEDDNVVGITPYNQECLLDDSGTIISNDYIKIYKFSNSVAPVKLTTPEDKIKYGFINDLGKELIEPCYDDATEFHNHYAGVLLKNKWGVIDDNLNIVVKPSIKCSALTVIANNLLLMEKKKRKIITDFNSNIIYKLNTNETEKLDYENKVIYVFDSNLDIYTKLIDKDCKVVDISSYNISKILDNNIIEYKDGKYGILNKDLKPPVEKYDSIQYNCNNSYIVSRNNHYGVINKEGKIIITIMYDSISFNEEKYYITKIDNIKELHDIDGKYIELIYGNERIKQYKNGLIVMYVIGVDDDPKEYILYDNSFNKIVSSKDRIYIVDYNSIILENHLVNLNEEYLNFEYIYELKVNYKGTNYKQFFETEDKLNNCIKELQNTEAIYFKKEMELKVELKKIKNELTDMKDEEGAKVKQLIKLN